MEKDNKSTYWNNRYSKGGKIWGETPSLSALYALKSFKKYNIEKILIPGSGYGRHTKFFSENNYSCVGIEISEIAIKIAKCFDPLSNFIKVSVLEMEIGEEIYDAIYCFNTLHLFLLNEREIFQKKCYDLLKEGGLSFFTVFSEQEPSYGKGKRVELNTFESKPGRPTHYFTEDDLIKHFRNYKVLKTGIIEEQEDHGERGPHNHILRYIFAQKLG
ncbi:MAG: class I SAM-dependent methyltransferase [Candidatus Thorarchaeota archaeon]